MEGTRYDLRVSAGLLGPVAVWAAIAFAVLAVVTGRRWALITTAVFGVLATVVLGVALVTYDFSLAYVAETTSRATPWPYRLAALWGGMDGSLLLYAVMIVAMGAAALSRPIPVRTAASVGSGLLLITVFFANPFSVLELPAVDGSGLLAILQHPAMIYHPPILYLGLTTLIVPFALTVEKAIRGNDRSIWIDRARRWSYVSWTLLTIGMAAGANWAYVELGWGGYWAWDPVENTALMPWIAITVFLHTSRVEEATGRLRRWDAAYAMIPFALTVMGVYLTRSGATGSIHSFAEDPLVGRILLASAVVVGLFAMALAIRSEPGEPWVEWRLDRNGWLAVNATLLTAALVFITAGSAYPAFASVFRGESIAVDPRFFVITILPVAVLIAASLASALRARWVAFAWITAMAAVGIGLVAGWRPGVLLIAPALASLVLLSVGLATSRRGGRRITIYLAHMGMAVLLVAVAGSSFGGEFTGSMIPGESVTVAGHEIALRDVETGEGDRFVYVRALFDVDGEQMSPEIRAYEDQEVPVAEPVARVGLIDDVIVAVSLLFPDENTVEVNVFVRPLVSWVWVGASLIGLAGLIALLARDGAASMRRRSAREALQSGETTSGTVSR